MELSTFIETIVGTGAISTFATFLVTRKKYLSEVKSNDIENLRSMLQIYIDIVEDNKKRLDDYQNQLEKANNRVAMLTDETIALRNEVKEVRTENEFLKNKLANINI